MMFRIAALATVFAASSAQAKKHPNSNLLLKELPNTGESWSTLTNGVEVQPASNLSPLAQEHWRRLTSSGSSGSDADEYSAAYQKIFVDGAETYYDEYAQAWRALGFYIDCDYQGENNDGGSGCSRFLLWAAYVDENYQGGGVNEYMYYDRKNDRWDATACHGGNDPDYWAASRCAKMDCHLEDTQFSLLGFFKEPNYDEWMEQLFKHEGDCVWTDEEYRFMQGHREVWPDGCTESAFETDNGEVVYYDLKPMPYGDMDIGLYVDSSCIVPYSGDLTAEEVLRTMMCGGGRRAQEGNNDWMCTDNYSDYEYGKAAYLAQNNTEGDDQDDGSLWSLEVSINRWNEAFDVWKQCQPCKTYDLSNFVAGYNYDANADGNRYGEWMYNVQGGDEDADAFRCSDAAGYDNVNQCMKFQTKTRMMTATWTDAELAAIQGTVTTMQIPNLSEGSFAFRKYGINNGAHSYGKSFRARSTDQQKYMASIIIVLISSMLFGCSLYRWIVAKDEYAEVEAQQQPLMANEKAVTA